MKEMTLEEVKALVSKNAMEGYLAVQHSGLTNMFDYTAVMRLARRFGSPDLAALDKSTYVQLLKYYGQLLDAYGLRG